MRNINHTNKIFVCSICAILVLWALGAQAAATLPPDPDNAALLYYQAFLLRPEPNDAIEDLLYGVLHWTEPDEKIREYLKDCRETIKYTEAATKMPKCDWGLLYSQGNEFSSELIIQLRSLEFLLSADARTLTADGDYLAALDRCLMILRLSRHIGDETSFSYSASAGCDVLAIRSIQHVLGSIPLDADTLTWLKKQLAIIRGEPLSLVRALEMDFEILLQAMRTNGKTLPWLRNQLAKNVQDNSAKEKIRSLTDEELLAHAREPYAKFLDSVLQTMRSDMPYESTYAEIQRLTDKLNQEAKSNPAIILSMKISSDKVVKLYGLQVQNTAHFSALKAAIEIYLAVANTGRLPEALPAGLSKDPYSGQDFKYEMTKEGFVLRYGGKDVPGGWVRQLECKVQR